MNAFDGLNKKVRQSISTASGPRRTNSSRNNSNNNNNSATVDDVLSLELMNLSLDDRNAVQEEIHGVRCLAPDESPELLARALREFQKELGAIVSKNKKEDESNGNSKENCGAYELILTACGRRSGEEGRERNDAADTDGSQGRNGGRGRGHYALDDPDFRLRFLRCELFDVPKAARRFLSYLDFVRELWGDVVLRRQIGAKDFGSSDSSSNRQLRKGYYQLLPFRDRSGRRVVVSLCGATGQQRVDFLERAKAVFYVLDVATRDSVESQRCGAVTICQRNIFDHLYNHNGSFSFSQKDLALAKKLFASVPTRIVAVHFYLPNAPAYHLLGKIIALGSYSVHRARLKFQFGDDIEMRYKLKTYGIPVELLPLTETGTIKIAYYNQWIKTRKLLEEKKQKEKPNNKNKASAEDSDDDAVVAVECPTLNDVVFRQGTAVLTNPGNSMFRDLIVTYLEEKEERDERFKNSGGEREQVGVVVASNDGNKDEAATANDNNKSSRIFDDSTLDSDQNFREWLIDEVLLRRKGRFLDWDNKMKSWVVMKSKELIRRKVSVSIYSAVRRHQRQQSCAGAGANNNGASSIRDNNKSYNGDEGNSMAYHFLEGGRRPSSSRQCFCDADPAKNANTSRKRTRRDS